MVANYTASLDDIDVTAKSSRSSFNDGVLLLELSPPRKSSSASPDNRKSSQPVVTNAAEVIANQITHPKMFKPSSWSLQHGAPNSFIALEASIASNLEEIRKANITDISTLENLVETFFKAYAEYDSLRSLKMTKESHQESLSDAQRGLHDAKQEHKKLDGSVEKLQVNLAKVEKDLAALSSKKEKIIALLDKSQEKLSKNQEKITITEDEIYTIEANHTLSDDEVERLSKHEEAKRRLRRVAKKS
ncbi:hypothetical protein RND71_039745 [Anisodus tanguticus]|uniref:Uncharacterized protein n=1 Tax=Anisodus tanguticus TaxID=243964 RepID=A0AAE1UXW0_9SOLA|nr:hypothetical protein RND71_039745 [Anisodus tanguticus]